MTASLLVLATCGPEENGLPRPLPELRKNEEQYLQRLEGMIYGENPRDGFLSDIESHPSFGSLGQLNLSAGEERGFGSSAETAGRSRFAADS